MRAETEAMPAGGFQVFLRIWTGQVASTLGSSMTNFAVGVWIYQSTGSASRYALIIFFSTLPALLVSPLTGALADRWNRRRILIAGDSAAGLCTLVLILLVWQGRLEIWHVYALVTVNSVFSSLQMPAFTASVALLVPRRHLGRAAGMSQAGEAASRIASPLLAGVLLEKISLFGILFLDLATLGIAVSLLLSARIPQPPPAAEERAGETEQKTLAGDMRFGFVYVRARPGLLALLVMFAGTNFALGIVQSLVAPLVLSHGSPQDLGMVLSIASGGLLAGGLLASIWGGPARRVRGIFVCMVLQALVLVAVGFVPAAGFLAGATFLFMSSLAVLSSASTALWQSKVAPALQGRVFAIRRMVAMSCLPLAYLLGGPLAERVFEPVAVSGLAFGLHFDGAEPGIRLFFVTLGLLLLLILAAGYSYPRLRRVEEELPDALAQAEGAAAAAR